jgi:putative transcriptional regulator
VAVDEPPILILRLNQNPRTQFYFSEGAIVAKMQYLDDIPEICKVCLTFKWFSAIICKVSFTKGGCMRNRLEELRNQKGWTQQELADRTAVSRQTIISLEKGRYNPSITLAFRLARQFEAAIEDVFIYSDEEDNHE